MAFLPKQGLVSTCSALLTHAAASSCPSIRALLLVNDLDADAADHTTSLLDALSRWLFPVRVHRAAAIFDHLTRRHGATRLAGRSGTVLSPDVGLDLLLLVVRILHEAIGAGILGILATDDLYGLTSWHRLHRLRHGLAEVRHHSCSSVRLRAQVGRDRRTSCLITHYSRLFIYRIAFPMLVIRLLHLHI